VLLDAARFLPTFFGESKRLPTHGGVGFPVPVLSRDASDFHVGLLRLGEAGCYGKSLRRGFDSARAARCLEALDSLVETFHSGADSKAPSEMLVRPDPIQIPATPPDAKMHMHLRPTRTLTKEKSKYSDENFWIRA
jgi:hypothetical protein